MNDLWTLLLSHIKEITLLFGILTLIIFLRYLVLAGAYHRLIYQKVASLNNRRIISKLFDQAQIRKEIIWSGISAFIFGLIGAVMLFLVKQGYSAVYIDINEYPWWYIPISLAVVLFIHETYYYWLHRWLHRPKIYKFIHQVHHQSVHTNAWTSFSFHPTESILQAIIIPIILWIIPLHYSVVFLFLIIMTISAIINHAGVEIFPAGWARHPIMKWFIGATHHDVHHRKFTKNYGLYFTFWDRWMGTENDNYIEQFESVTSNE
jgi:sterol desaturase/sphingolipid hydroxylase (fatty acid hydroxylase superfamily)